MGSVAYINIPSPRPRLMCITSMVLKQGASYKEVTTDHTQYLASVANVCAQSPYGRTVAYSQPELWFKDLPQDRVTKMIVEDAPLGNGALSSPVELLILPKDLSGSWLSWPSFDGRKQIYAMGRHLVLVKRAPISTMPLYSRTGSGPDSCENIVDMLLRGESVALVGPESIGKFTELNAVLLPLFRSLLDPQSPLQDVFQRVDCSLYRYRAEDGTISCSEVEDVGSEMQDVNAYFRLFKNRKDIERGLVPRNDVVLLLEVSESEIDVGGDPISTGRGWKGPPIDARFTHIPTAVALSARRFRDALRTFVTAGVVRFAARPPHTDAELAVLVSALYHGGSEATKYGEGDRADLCENMGLPAGASLQEVLRVLQERVDTVGPIIRAVLSSNYYSHYRYEMESRIF